MKLIQKFYPLGIYLNMGGQYDRIKNMQLKVVNLGAKKFTIKNFQNSFGTDEQCIDFILQKRFPKSLCSKCGEYTKFYKIKGRTKKFDTSCHHKVSPLKGTPLEKTKTSISLIFYIAFMVSVAKNGISALEIKRQTGLSYQTSWDLLRKIRKAMIDDVQVVSGTVEMDETYVGGKESNRHHHKNKINLISKARHSNKTTVIGIKSRNTNKLVANVAKSSKKKVLFNNVKEHIGMNSLILTDELQAYRNISEIEDGNWRHLAINHSKGTYARHMLDRFTSEVVNVSTNGIEGFWSVFKRGVKGTYIHISRKHMQNYVNEFVYRYNNRKENLFFKILNKLIL